LWTIKGGQGDFVELGQTWSSPLVKKMKIGSKMKDVLIFGGGYDPRQDSNTKHTDDSQGRAIYIVDALTGAKIWWAGPEGSKANGANVAMPELTNGIVSEILALSLEGEGEGVTRLYVTDTRGQLFRFDINLKNTGASDLVEKPYLLAKLSEEGTIKGTRRLYYSADAALMKGGYIALIMGTGYQAHPLEVNEQNRIYMIKDKNVAKTPETIPATIVASNLVNTTTLPSTVAQKAERANALSNSDGWYFDLDKGEKVLSKPLILDGKAIITSFTANKPLSDPCKAGVGGGIGSVYRIDLATSAPPSESNTDGNTSASNGDTSTSNGNTSTSARKVKLKREGIPPTPVLIVTKDGTAVLSGSTISDVKAKNNNNSELEKTYWYEDKTGTDPMLHKK
jgi:type IV pilus assembly protein PilY1